MCKIIYIKKIMILHLMIDFMNWFLNVQLWIYCLLGRININFVVDKSKNNPGNVKRD